MLYVRVFVFLYVLHTPQTTECESLKYGVGLLKCNETNLKIILFFYQELAFSKRASWRAGTITLRVCSKYFVRTLAPPFLATWMHLAVLCQCAGILSTFVYLCNDTLVSKKSFNLLCFLCLFLFTHILYLTCLILSINHSPS